MKKPSKQKMASKTLARKLQRGRGLTGVKLGPDIPVRLEDGRLNPEYRSYWIYRINFLIRCTLEMTDRIELEPPSAEYAARIHLTHEEAIEIFLRAMKVNEMQEKEPGKWSWSIEDSKNRHHAKT
jgi:hypothetical protein